MWALILRVPYAKVYARSLGEIDIVLLHITCIIPFCIFDIFFVHNRKAVLCEELRHLESKDKEIPCTVRTDAIPFKHG